MPEPFVLVQLSDPHVGAEADADPLARLAAAVEAVRALRPPPHAMLISGDLADHGAESEYVDVRQLVSAIGVPVYVVAGNHIDGQLASHVASGPP